MSLKLCSEEYFTIRSSVSKLIILSPSAKYDVNSDILKCVCIRYSPAETSTINTPSSKIYINIPREESVISFLNSYLNLNF